MKTPEAVEKDAICAYLKSIGAWYFRPYMTGFGQAGVADIIACIQQIGRPEGFFWAIEVKRPGAGPTPRQQTRMGEIRAAGGMAVAGDRHAIREEIEKWRRTFHASSVAS